MPTIAHQEKLFSLKNLLAAVLVSLLLVLFDNIGLLDPVKNFGVAISEQIAPETKAKFLRFDNWRAVLMEKEKLTAEIAELEAELTALRSENVALISENEQLELLKNQNSFNTEYKSTPARVVLYISDRFGHIVLNKGEEAGISLGSPVVVENYLLGEVVQVEQDSAVVRLIIAPESSIPAESETTKSRGIVKGNIATGLVMEAIPVSSQIEESEQILTTGVNSAFPNGLIIGRVREITEAASLPTQSAELELLFDFNSLENVFILTKP